MFFDSSGDVFLTIKDITQAVAPDKSVDGLNRTLRQVRHWTQCDLIRPRQQKNPGKGSTRVYDEDPTIMVSAILLELNRYGATVDILGPVSNAIYADTIAEGGDDVLFMAMNNEANAFLQVVWIEDEKTKKFTGASINLFHDFDASEEDELWTNPTSSIVLNLNKIAERIFPTPWADEAFEHRMKASRASDD